jgi:protein involved in ribonucleotide reduction
LGKGHSDPSPYLSTTERPELSLGIVYFSNYSGNTHKFVERFMENDGANNAIRIPVSGSGGSIPVVPWDFVLFCPTYGGGSLGAAIPRQVKKFLNIPENRDRLRGVVGFGNKNFGEDFCKAAELISAKTGVPIIARVEIFGTQDDLALVKERLELVYGQ